MYMKPLALSAVASSLESRAAHGKLSAERTGRLRKKGLLRCARGPSVGGDSSGEIARLKRHLENAKNLREIIRNASGETLDL
jgi:hypothetical protein